MYTTRITRYIDAPRAKVFAVLLDADSLAQWRVPDGMTSLVHTFEPRVNGAVRVSLTYDAPDAEGKTSKHTDTYHGIFSEIVPNERIVEIDEFETDDPQLQGEMTITITLADFKSGTQLAATHEGLPDSVPPKDNETGWRMSLEKLAALVEGRA